MEALFDHEKLGVYCVELQFTSWIADFLRDVVQSSAPHRRELIEQLDRASLSMLLNTAEGNSKRHGRHRAKYFDDARGSAFECAACLDASVAKCLASTDRIRLGKECSRAS
jgi:four helix bundle protein